VAVSQSDVEALMGNLSTSAVPAAISQVTVMAKAYTRGNGFDAYGEPNDEISAVIVTGAARLAANGSGTQYRKKVDDVEIEYRSSFQGWTLAELAVLNRYRVRAM
jgi:hypothetical protein